MDSPIPGMDMARTSLYPQHQGAPLAGLPSVRVDVRNGSARPALYDISGEEFLIGSVPGCDLRLPGTNLPPVVCLITRQPDGVRLRRLAPTLPVLVNGQPIAQTAPTHLTQGDCISIGAVDLYVAIDFAILPAPVVQFTPIAPPERDDRLGEQTRREMALKERERQIEEQTRELEADRILWYRRRDEIEKELQQARDAATRFDRSGSELTAREIRLQNRDDELHRRQNELNAQQEELLKLREETLATRRDNQDQLAEKRDRLTKDREAGRESLESIRKREENLEAEFAGRRETFEADLKERREKAESELRQWHNQGASGLTNLREQIERELSVKTRSRAEELDRFQLSLREAALQLREKKQQLDEEIRQYEPNRVELAERAETLGRQQEEIDGKTTELQREREVLELDRRAQAEPLVQRERDLADREGELERQMQQWEADRETIEKGKSQYQADLIRLDRWQVTLDEKERHLQARAVEIDQRHGAFQRDSGDLEEQVLQIDAREEQFRAEDQRQAKQRHELDEREAKLNERLAQIEGQQTMLAALRTRLEHRREEHREEVGRLVDERTRLEENTREAQDRLLEAERLREQLSGERTGQTDSERLFKERSDLLQQAVGRLRDLQKQLTEEDERLRQLTEDLEAKGADLSEREGLLKARMDQVLDQQQRLDADRQALKQREESLFLTEGTRESLQDQLRRRAEELMGRGRDLDARTAELDEQSRQMAEQREALESLRTEASSSYQQMMRESSELTKRDEQLRQAEQTIAEQRKQFEEAQARWEQQQREADEKTLQARTEIDDLKRAMSKQAADLFGQVPDMESRAQAALDRTSQARESLRSQLTELHAYTRQNQEDLEKVRTQVQSELERMHQQEAALTRSRTEHRHAVASFKQQLIEWQSRFSDMKQTLSHGESRIERREKVVEATTQQLAKQAEELESKQRDVVERRGEMHRHLHDMRDWYRKKLRELVESRNAQRGTRNAESSDEDILPLPVHMAAVDSQNRNAETGTPVILTLQDDLDPADRKLGELMKSLELVDAETLTALWAESRRLRRPLRQVLLAGGYLTLFQLALIESGNVTGLVLGRFRVTDRLQSTAREAIYRVYDPQSGNCLLRHLGESEMLDAVRPDEYRQRFGAARDVAHPNLAATLEVLDINGRPAIVQEWLNGLPGGEFSALAGVPGVWFRLLSQAALGLHTAHQAGLVHGRLTANSLLLTREGVLKIAGFGEPPWLQAGVGNVEATAEDDLRSLGRIVFDWQQLVAKRKGKKGLPEGLLGVLRGLGAETNDGIPLALYPNVAALLEDLDRVSSEVPADGASWDKLLAHVVENATEGPLLRKSA